MCTIKSCSPLWLRDSLDACDQILHDMGAWFPETHWCHEFFASWSFSDIRSGYCYFTLGSVFDHVFLFHVHITACILLVVTLGDVTDLMVFQILNTNIPLIYLKKSKLVNHNNIQTCTQPTVAKGDVYSQTIFHQAAVDPFHHILVVGWNPTHPPAIEAWIPCLPWNSAIAWVPNFRPWICPIRVLLAGRDKHGVSIWICMYMIYYIYDIQISRFFFEIMFWNLWVYSCTGIYGWICLLIWWSRI